MSARLKLKHMKHHIAMVEANNAHLRYELARLSREWELIGVSERLDNLALEMAPRQYFLSVVSHTARVLTEKMCENLKEYIAKRLSNCDGYFPRSCGNTLDVKLITPKFTETSVDVTVR